MDALAAWSFTAPRINGSIDAMLERAATPSRARPATRMAPMVPNVRTAGTLIARWRVYGPSGSLECSGYGGEYQAVSCWRPVSSC